MPSIKYKRRRSLKKYSTKRKSRKSKKSQSAAKRRSRKRLAKKKKGNRFGSKELTPYTNNYDEEINSIIQEIKECSDNDKQIKRKCFQEIIDDTISF